MLCSDLGEITGLKPCCDELCGLESGYKETVPRNNNTEQKGKAQNVVGRAGKCQHFTIRWNLCEGQVSLFTIPPKKGEYV